MPELLAFHRPPASGDVAALKLSLEGALNSNVPPVACASPSFLNREPTLAGSKLPVARIVPPETSAEIRPLLTIVLTGLVLTPPREPLPPRVVSPAARVRVPPLTVLAIELDADVEPKTTLPVPPSVCAAWVVNRRSAAPPAPPSVSVPLTVS